jgi:hypothetical protein
MTDIQDRDTDEFVRLVEAVIESADDTGCSDDLTVVSKPALGAVTNWLNVGEQPAVPSGMISATGQDQWPFFLTAIQGLMIDKCASGPYRDMLISGLAEIQAVRAQRDSALTRLERFRTDRDVWRGECERLTDVATTAQRERDLWCRAALKTGQVLRHARSVLTDHEAAIQAAGAPTVAVPA